MLKPKIYMCSPEFFGIEYSINPWMDVEINSNKEKTMTQWKNLYKLITEEAGAEVITMPGCPNLPDIVFTANAALIYKNKAIISRFRHKERQPEENVYEEWFKAQGYEVIILDEEMKFEGAGDALFLGDNLFAGYAPRTNISSHVRISELLNVRVMSLELTDDRFYHLDTCFCPLTDEYLLYYPKAFDDYGNTVIENFVPEEKRIPVTEEEALTFSCNSVCVGQTVIMNNLSGRLKETLESKGFKAYETSLSEFMKAGGSSKCLTLKLDDPHNLFNARRLAFSS